MKSTQTSKLLPALFEHIDENQRITVLHIGSALPETVNFFSTYRCKLHFIDLFSELPFTVGEKNGVELSQQFSNSLMLPADCQFDLCLFWDIFNYLSPAAITAFMTLLKPHLNRATRAHGFGMHKVKGPQGNQLYGLGSMESIVVRSRSVPPPGYAPLSQGVLKNLLSCFSFERSVLLADGRLELLLNAKL